MTQARLALVLTGGGARAAYQVGFLRCLARRMPEVRLSVLTGVSAGAINVACLAAGDRGLTESVDRLSSLWLGLRPQKVFRVDTPTLLSNLLRWGLRLISSGRFAGSKARSLLDTRPLHDLLATALNAATGPIPAVARNLENGRLDALAVTTLNFSTGQTVTWVQGDQLEGWERPARLGISAEITVSHIMASAALPLFFPAVRLGEAWHGDGGVRMLAPLAPAIHLGADRILAISTRHPRSASSAAQPVISGYPPPAQVASMLLNAIFLDAIDQDALQLERINRLVEQLQPAQRGNLRPLRLLVLRPSLDLGRLAAELEPRLPGTFRFLTRGFGTRETSSPDFLSLLMFQHDYLARLIDIGEHDAEARLGEIDEFFGAA